MSMEPAYKSGRGPFLLTKMVLGKPSKDAKVPESLVSKWLAAVQRSTCRVGEPLSGKQACEDAKDLQPSREGCALEAGAAQREKEPDEGGVLA